MRIPAITWGTSFTNTLTIQYPVDNWSAYSVPREGSDWVVSLSGLESAWIVGYDYYLACDIRWIPTATANGITGWDGSTGWDAFLRWAQAKHQFRWIPDATTMGTFVTSYLVEPLGGGVQLEVDGTKSVRLVMRNATTAYTGY
jgi:hypothetical protein